MNAMTGKDTLIIAVADAYDAMNSNRSYRDRLSQKRTRDELIRGAGTQFDPCLAEIMVHMLDSGEVPDTGGI